MAGEGGLRLLSVDIGTRNVAFAVFDSAPGLRVRGWGVRDLQKDDGGVVASAVELAAALTEEHGPFDKVALENQLGRFAAQNKAVQSVLHASMLLLCPGCDVVNVSPRCKTTLAGRLIPARSAERVADSARGKSAKRASCITQKQTVVAAAAECLAVPSRPAPPAADASRPAPPATDASRPAPPAAEDLAEDPRPSPPAAEDLAGDPRPAPLAAEDVAWMSELFGSSRKKDDLSDCLLQGLHVLHKSGRLRLVGRGGSEGPDRGTHFLALPAPPA